MRRLEKRGPGGNILSWGIDPGADREIFED